jgi:hypothetical protein
MKNQPDFLVHLRFSLKFGFKPVPSFPASGSPLAGLVALSAIEVAFLRHHDMINMVIFIIIPFLKKRE